MEKQYQSFLGRNFYLREDGYFVSGPYKAGSRYLHRAVWEHYYGPIPKGFCIHHRDGDKGNNALSNLELLPAGKHATLHLKKRIAADPEKARLQGMLLMRKAAEWRRDNPEKASALARKIGFAGYETRKLMPKTKKVCIHCGKEYEVLYGSHGKFCTKACQSAYRRKSGVDNEERECVVCGNKFSINKYAKTKTCSKDCWRELLSINRKRRNFRSVI